MSLAAPCPDEEHYRKSKSSDVWWMAQPVKVLAAEPGKQSLIPKTHLVVK